MSNQNLPLLTGDWEKDEPLVTQFAEKPVSAEAYFDHARVIETLFKQLTHDTRFAPAAPRRIGLSLEIHRELYPIGHFARLYFEASEGVIISWRRGSQNFDATLDDQREAPARSDLQYLEVTTLQDNEDSELLDGLAKSPNGTIGFFGDHEYDTHQRKLAQLRLVLEKKGKKTYPDRTALIVYTDEHRFAQYTFGGPRREIDRKSEFSAVLAEMAPLLGKFAEVHIFSKDEIYCSIGAKLTSSPGPVAEAPPSSAS